MIREELSRARIAITGSTGFLGTALVERLLRAVPECELVLVVRPGRRGAQHRVERDILRNDAFDRLRSAYAEDPVAAGGREGESFDEMASRRVFGVAGDVATANAVTRQALLLLKARFEEVIWCPGNHELWLPAAPNDATLRGYPDDSLGKLMSLIDLCVECGVRVGPTTLPGTPGTARGEKKNADVFVAPVLGWYDDAFGGRSRTGYPYTDLERDFDAGCKWPACVGTPGRPRDSHAEGIARFFRDVNDAVWADASIVPGGVLINDDDEKTKT